MIKCSKLLSFEMLQFLRGFETSVDFRKRLLKKFNIKIIQKNKLDQLLSLIYSIPPELFEQGYHYYSLDVASLFPNVPSNRTNC